MRRKIYAAVISCVVVLALALVGQAGASASDDGRSHQNCQHASKHTRWRVSRARNQARERRKEGQRAISYVCPKCLMDLVAEPPGASMGREGLARKLPPN
ncbi:MAG TPA: hypothetical protein VF762_17855 [Blastocatellia bacterium]|jgi:hypothetical protein